MSIITLRVYRGTTIPWNTPPMETEPFHSFKTTFPDKAGTTSVTATDPTDGTSAARCDTSA